jgi:hypothetical protein
MLCADVDACIQQLSCHRRFWPVSMKSLVLSGFAHGCLAEIRKSRQSSRKARPGGPAESESQRTHQQDQDPGLFRPLRSDCAWRRGDHTGFPRSLAERSAAGSQSDRPEAV